MDDDLITKIKTKELLKLIQTSTPFSTANMPNAIQKMVEEINEKKGETAEKEFMHNVKDFNE